MHAPMEDAPIVLVELNLIHQIAIRGKEPVAISSIKNGYDANIQITSKLNQLHVFGHDATKIELVVVGGTFLFMPKDYQENFIKSCYDALNGFPSPNLEIAMEK